MSIQYLSNDKLLRWLIYIYLHKDVGRGEKKTKSVYEVRPQITTPRPQSFLDCIVPNRKSEIRTKIEPIQKTFLSSSLTDNAISVQVMRLLQLDLEFSVQCPTIVHKRRNTMEIKHVNPQYRTEKKNRKRTYSFCRVAPNKNLSSDTTTSRVGPPGES